MYFFYFALFPSQVNNRIKKGINIVTTKKNLNIWNECHFKRTCVYLRV